MGKNPFPIIVPCHRVLAANGKMGGFSARGGVSTKLRMLNIEQAGTGNTPTLFGNLPLGMPPKRRRAPAQT
jgi:methylated-DNA-[protein]-cysteine S-methyltransferase